MRRPVEHKNHADWLRWADRQGRDVYVSVALSDALRAGADAVELLQYVPVKQLGLAFKKMNASKRKNREQMEP